MRFAALLAVLVLMAAATWSCGRTVMVTVDASPPEDASVQDVAKEEASSQDVANVPFACGEAGTCQSATQYCEQDVIGDVLTDAGPPVDSYCHPLPQGCHSCACLKAAGYPGIVCCPTCGLGGFDCTDYGGIVTIWNNC
jgi:hypothetical protein